VKLRGLRIELGEIETILSQSMGVQNAAVLVREDQPGKQVLVGYVSPVGVNVEETLAFLATKVPPYMVTCFILYLLYFWVFFLNFFILFI
jgi:acyl-coenzyme A synthetase/AMP-(fatty) acid ligase